jgi:hypothetical protein
MKRHLRDDERVTVYRVDPDPTLFEVVGERSHGETDRKRGFLVGRRAVIVKLYKVLVLISDEGHSGRSV